MVSHERRGSGILRPGFTECFEEKFTIRQDTLGTYRMNRRKMVEWLEEHGFRALFIAETQAIEAKRK